MSCTRLGTALALEPKRYVSAPVCTTPGMVGSDEMGTARTGSLRDTRSPVSSYS